MINRGQIIDDLLEMEIITKEECMKILNLENIPIEIKKYKFVTHSLYSGTKFDELHIHFGDDKLWGFYSLANLRKYNDYIKTMYMLSQEEIDALVKEMQDSLNSMNGITKAPEQLNFFDIPLPSENESKCTVHTWKTYQGLKETFEYCSICDAKK